MRIPRPIRQLLIGTLILSLLLVLAGVAYALYADQSTPLLPVVEEAPASTSPLKHLAPSPNTPESAAVQGITSPVKAGDQALINIQTLAGSVCTIAIGYTGAPSNDASFAERTADAYGAVSWNWVISASAPTGSWPVKTTCVDHDRSAVVDANLQIIQ